VLLALKFLLAPSLVALASLAGRRWGLRIGGAIAGFPVVVGPILLFFAMEQGSAFAATAALKSLWGMFPFAVFCLVMSWLSLRLPLWPSMLSGWAAFLGVSWLGLGHTPGLLASSLIAAGSIWLGRRFLPPGHGHVAAKAAPARWDIPARMFSTLALVLGLTAAAKALGPEWSGALAPFPVASSVLGAFAFLSDGPRGPGLLYRGTLAGCFAYGTFCGALSWALGSFGLATAFGMAIFAAVLVQIGALFLLTRKN
jgi:hypothetical protein